MSGEMSGLAEPALVLTPSDVATDVDDGLLTASEAALLNLNADWVILSACNTAAADEPGADGLSGLARSFFYAGARSMLVLMNDTSDPSLAHPSAWAPFVIVGEGGSKVSANPQNFEPDTLDMQTLKSGEPRGSAKLFGLIGGVILVLIAGIIIWSKRSREVL